MDYKKPKTIIIAALLLFGLIGGVIFQRPSTDKMQLIFCDVGQGDAILAIYDSFQALIDGGPNEQVLSCLAKHMPFWDRDLEMVVLTHPEADHLTGLIPVIERYNVKQFVVNSLVKDSAVFWHFREQVLVEGVAIYSPQAGDEIKLGPMVFQVLWPANKIGSELVWQSPVIGDKDQVLGVATFAGELNDSSIVLKLSYGDFDALLTGDISSDTEEELALRNELPTSGSVEVLKVAHHGSRYSTSADFLSALKPALAVISVGKNTFRHPTEEALTELTQQAVKILRTDKVGEVTINSDGQKWWLN